MNLVDVLINNNVSWPANADTAYQSAIDNEIYFRTKNGGLVHRTGRGYIPLCDNRGQKGMITYREYAQRKKDFEFFTRLKEEGGPTAMKQKERERIIKRIENGLRKDFDIDSPEFAVLMFEKGWRK
ncbi:hypothetical protein AVV44_gp241 [Cronobacter phage S13]|jgi:hypothetical protein|uniref:Uncharacterized protein n=1 Tax=Cronobacter phage LPCS28 TaxID=2924885 RepID=A0AAE9K641_9CAUD|nr:hypothetical protein AVV44_gp241 [Cronobacter phage S13]YP_010665780.1 hypothetical protein PQB73_gp244 [Cronobacter phage LPCS28]AIA64997.1 hypothetical protein S13_200 [Cronobacter phage S13]UNY46969.1 hypothetical protein EHEKIMEA_00086 [Cronobacter phage LPCS28]